MHTHTEPLHTNTNICMNTRTPQCFLKKKSLSSVLQGDLVTRFLARHSTFWIFKRFIIPFVNTRALPQTQQLRFNANMNSTSPPTQPKGNKVMLEGRRGKYANCPLSQSNGGFLSRTTSCGIERRAHGGD